MSNDGWCRIRVNMHTSAGGSRGSRRDAVCGTASHTRGGGSGIKSFATCLMCRPARNTPLFRRWNGNFPRAARGDGVVFVSMRVSGDMRAVGNRRRCSIHVTMHVIIGGGKGGRHGAIDACTSEGGGEVSISAADAAVAAAPSAACRRMHERKEDMCSVVGGAAAVRTGSVPTAMPIPAA